MVSIVIPVYNGEKYIKRCVESIMDNVEKKDDIEIIVINDGSKDNTLQICNELKQSISKMKVISQNNSGVSAARNKGVELSSGEWIMFVDADDIITGGFIDIIEKYKNSYDWIIFSKRFMQSEIYDVNQNVDSLMKAILRNHENNTFNDAYFNAVWSKVYKKSLILNSNIFFNSDIHHGEDMLYNLKYLKACTKVVCISEGIYTVCANSNSATHIYQKMAVKNDKMFLCELLNYKSMFETEDFDTIYYKIVNNGLWICLGQYFAHPLNKNSRKTIINELYTMLQSEPYKTALKKHRQTETTLSHRIVFNLLYYHLYSTVLMIFKKISATKKNEAADKRII